MSNKFWKTKSGESIKISDMQDSHLINTLKLLIRNYNKILVSWGDGLPKSISQFRTTNFINLLEEYKKRDINIALLEVYHKTNAKSFNLDNLSNVLYSDDDFEDTGPDLDEANEFLDENEEKDLNKEFGYTIIGNKKTNEKSGQWAWGFNGNIYPHEVVPQKPKPKPAEKPPIKQKSQIYIPGKRKINLE